MRAFIALATLAALAAPAQAQRARPAAAADAETARLLDAAIAGPWRTEAERARDSARNPKETLRFFGLKPNMTVVEITPSGGYYTAIIAPVLRERGRYIAAHNNPAASPAAARAVQAFRDRFSDRAVFGNIGVTVFNRQTAMGAFAAPNSADMVLTFRNVHNFLGNGFAPDAFRGFFKALKPGGVLGIEEHRLPEDRQPGPGVAGYNNSGYVKQSEVIRMAQEAGFEFVGASEVNANPRDTADHPNGVWSLPPTLRGGDVDRQKFVDIGESDRMTLKFRKPLR